MGDLFKIAVQHVSVALLAALGVAWLVAWAWREHRRACAKLSPGTAAALLAMAFAATIEAQPSLRRQRRACGNGVCSAAWRGDERRLACSRRVRGLVLPPSDELVGAGGGRRVDRRLARLLLLRIPGAA